MIKVQPRRCESRVRVADSGPRSSDITRPRVGAEHLKAMREALIGAHQQALVGLIAGRLPYLDGAGRTECPRIVLLSAGASGNHRTADAVEMVQVKAARAQASMDEVPEDEIGAEDEVTGDLALQSQVYVLRGPTRNVGGRQEGSGYLFYDLERS